MPNGQEWGNVHGMWGAGFALSKEKALKPLGDCAVLYVDDDDVNAYLFERALRRNEPSPRFLRAADREEALAVLLPVEPSLRPDLVFLDLHLPGRSGLDVLSEIKSHPQMKDVPVVVFTSSMSADDRENSLNLGAVKYFRRDGSFDTFVKATDWACRRLKGDNTPDNPEE